MYTLSKLSYSDVQQKCKDLGGDLASIHDLNENSFVQALARDSKCFLTDNGDDEINMCSWLGGINLIESF